MNSTTHSDPTTEETSGTTDQKTTIQAMLRSLKTLLEGDENEQRETFEYLKKALDKDCPSDCRLFQ